MGSDIRETDLPRARRKRGWAAVPKPTPHFRRRAWTEFQRALDPLAPVKPLRSSQQH